jgi:hypothetical protein
MYLGAVICRHNIPYLRVVQVHTRWMLSSILVVLSSYSRATFPPEQVLITRQRILRARLSDCCTDKGLALPLGAKEPYRFCTLSPFSFHNRVLHETEHSVARDLQTRQITAEFDMGPAGLAPAAKVLFRGGLLSLLRQQPAYQTAWLIIIQAARARVDRRAGQSSEQQRDTFNPERLGMQRWLRTTNN